MGFAFSGTRDGFVSGGIGVCLVNYLDGDWYAWLLGIDGTLR